MGDKKVMVTEREQFVRDVLALIAAKTQLIEVTIQSAPHDRIQESVELTQIAADAKIRKQLAAKGWSVAYTFQREALMHRLVFCIDKDQKIKELNQQLKEKDEQLKEKDQQLREKDQQMKEIRKEKDQQMERIELLMIALRENGIDLPAELQ